MPEKDMMADNRPNRKNSSDDGGDTCAVLMFKI